MIEYRDSGQDGDIFDDIFALLERPAWHAQANCRGKDPNIFFPVRGKRATEAYALCEECDVQRECRDYAVTNIEPFGIWGGTGDDDRKDIRAGRPIGSRLRARVKSAKIRRLESHGTESSYQRHHYLMETPCAECRTAHAIHETRRLSRNGRKTPTRPGWEAWRNRKEQSA